MKAVDDQHKSTLSGLRWILRDEEGHTTVGPSRETAEPCELHPPLESALALAAECPDGGAPVTLDGPGGQSQAVRLVPVPHPFAVAVAVEATTLDDAVAPVVENLVNQIAHDIRNYAFTVGLQAELGIRRAAEAPEVRGHFEAVLRQVDVLKAYLERLLLYGRPAHLNPTKVEAASFVRQQVQAFQFSWSPASPPPSIGVEIEEQAGAVRWDTRCLGIALGAVLDNAAHSADPPPPIRVRLLAGGARLVVEVADEGRGIPPETVAKLAVPMSVRRAGGAGLGLAIARKMVAAHGGTVAIDSSPGGTTVRFDLPREVGAA
jgi:signal transduction histidine kinase